MTRECIVCGKKFEAKSHFANVCSEKCRKVRRAEIDRNSRLKRKKTKKKMSELSRINEEARALHMSYGQYVARYEL